MNQQVQLSALVDATLSEMTSKKYNRDTIGHHRRAYTALRRFCDAAGIEHYDEEVGDLFLQSIKERKPALCPGRIDCYKQYLARLNATLGGIPWKPRRGGRLLEYATSGYSDLVEEYETYLYKTGKTTHNVRIRCHRVARFLQFLEQQGCVNLCEISATHIYDAFKSVTDKRAFRSCVGAFLRHAKTYGLVTVDFSQLIPEVHSHVTVPAVYSPEEIEQLLASMERYTANGKRNYAIVLIAARLGLRACDIANMTFGCVNWKKHSIEIVQSKTKQPLKLPLLDDVAAALQEYIDRGRQPSEDHHIFLSYRGYGVVTAQSICGAVRRAFELSGIDLRNRRHGPHALRSSLATALLQEGNDFATIQKVLGQQNIQSSKSYAKADVEQLREIAIPVPLPMGAFAVLLGLQINSKSNHSNLGLLAQKIYWGQGETR